jgi:hypothetical protein
MRFLSIVLLTACALAPRPARALFCQSPSAIEAQLELCDDNEKFAAAAEACRNDYLKDVKAEQDKLGKQLRKNVAGAKDAGAQRASEALSASSYDATLARLDVLIARGVATHAEEMDYLSHFLPPFHWPAELGPLPPKNDPALWKAYDGEFCFGEHKETIDHMVKDVDQAVADLRKARKEAEELKGSSLTHKSRLGNDGAKAVTGGTGESAHGAGPKTPSGQSDITGVEQDKDKAKQPQ